MVYYVRQNARSHFCCSYLLQSLHTLWVVYCIVVSVGAFISKEGFVPYLNDYNCCILHVVHVYCVAAWNWCSACTGVLLNLTLRRLMSYIYGAPILDVSRSHTTTQHSR